MKNRKDVKDIEVNVRKSRILSVYLVKEFRIHRMLLI